MLQAVASPMMAAPAFTAEDLPAFNENIVGLIEVISKFRQVRPV